MREPLAWLPIPDTAPAVLVELRNWQVLSLGTWLLALVLYVLYFAIADHDDGPIRSGRGEECRQ